MPDHKNTESHAGPESLDEHERPGRSGEPETQYLPSYLSDASGYVPKLYRLLWDYQVRCQAEFMQKEAERDKDRKEH